ncbi:serine/threonine-protein kinase [Streptomyces sp. CRN 30]|uniref:serine/threonine-protein kinase n=1 Tax=Streptomyces sp. CRN 30 TaxID=3075613 RepID=UPI002A8154F9|nr:serine/threonine-protein kinase [Streptomyces sp. CRN 30]
MAPQRSTGTGPEAELPEYAGHYRLESCLGSGGMGVVHLARSTSGMRLAVKVVHAEFARDPEFRGRFRQEVAAARRVSGAFTAPVVDADPDAGRPWMATLFIDAPTLAEQVKRNGPLDAARLRRVMAGLAEALRDIHRVGVVHRDLKPSNVLLAEDGPKVIDFGISRPADSELRTETGKLIGTPPFMAPEQFRRPRDVGPAADVFALGSVMVHAATGRGPFDSDSPYVVAYQVVHDEPDLTGVPEPLAALVRRCLAKEPEERPTPDELMRRLRSVAASYDTQAFIPAQRTGAGPSAGVPAPVPDHGTAGPSEPSEPSGALPRRLSGLRRRSVLLAAGVCLAVAGTLVPVLLLGGADGSDRAPSGDARSAPAAFTGWAAAGAAGSAECSYGAGRLLCARPGTVFALDADDGSRLWERSVADASRSGPPVVSGGLVQPALNEGDTLEGLDPATGEPSWRRELAGYRGLRAVGGTLLVTGADGEVTGVDGATGAVLWTRRVPGQAVPHFSSFAGAGPAYATTVADDGTGTEVTAVDPATGDVRWHAEPAGALEPVGAADGSVVFLETDPVYGEARAVVRYTPGGGEPSRVALSAPVAQAHGSVRGDTVYLMGAGGTLTAVDLEAGKQRWSLETGVSRGSAPVADARHVYVTAPDGRLLGVDARTGKLLGQTDPRLGADSDRVAATLPSPVAAGGRVYASAPDGTVFAVDGGDPGGW